MWLQPLLDKLGITDPWTQKAIICVIYMSVIFTVSVIIIGFMLAKSLG